MKPVVTTLLGFAWLVFAAEFAGGGASPYVPEASPGLSAPALLPPEQPAARTPQLPRQPRREARRDKEPMILFTVR